MELEGEEVMRMGREWKVWMANRSLAAAVQVSSVVLLAVRGRGEQRAASWKRRRRACLKGCMVEAGLCGDCGRKSIVENGGW